MVEDNKQKQENNDEAGHNSHHHGESKIEPNSKKSYPDRFIDFLFSNDPRKWLIVIIILGAILRIIAAINVNPISDEMVHGPHAYGIIDSGVIGRVWQSILWSYLTDFFQILMGVSLLSTRFLSVLFGVMAIPLVYLIGKELFNQRVALISSLLLAFSPFSITYTRIEMDIPAIFFVLLASLFFIKSLKKDNNLSYLAALFIGIAALIKTLALFFVPTFVLFYLIWNKKIFDKKIIFSCIKFGGIILLIFSPILIHNFIWFTQNGMVDAYLSQYFDVGQSREAYAGIQGISHGFKFDEFASGILEATNIMLTLEPILFILGLVGLILLLFKKERFSIFFLLFELFAFILVTMTNRLTTHYVILSPILAIYSAFILDYIVENYLLRVNYKIKISILLVILILGSLFVAWPGISSKTGFSELRSYVSSKIPSDSLVVVDARTYRGAIMWAFIDKHYIESSIFPQLIDLNNNYSGNKINSIVYFVECASDDCGWGTIKDQPEFNQSTEALFDQVKDASSLITTMNGGGVSSIDSSQPYFRIYQANLALAPGIVSAADSTHSFFFYPVRYTPKEKVFDYYIPKGILNNSLFWIARAIIWISFIISLLSIFLVIYLVIKAKA